MRKIPKSLNGVFIVAKFYVTLFVTSDVVYEIDSYSCAL